LMPFITDEVWKRLPHDGETIVTASWPELAEIPVDREAHARFEIIMEAVGKARAFRASASLKPNERLDVDVPARLYDEARALLSALAVANVKAGEVDAPSLAEALAGITVRARPDVMRERLERERKKHEKDLEQSRARLANSGFVANAAPEAVAKERDKAAAAEMALERIQAELYGIG
jgi:valyl-tRNA synthetase